MENYEYEFIDSKKNYGAYLIATDGYFDSYGDSEKCSTLSRLIISSMDTRNYWEKSIVPMIYNLSINGSCDDVSIAVISDSSLNYLLFETISTHEIPVADHGNRTDQPLFKKRTYGSMNNGIITEKGTICSKGFFMDGLFVNNSLTAEGLLRYPDFNDDHKTYSGVLAPDYGLFVEAFFRDNIPIIDKNYKLRYIEKESKHKVSFLSD